MRNLGNQVYEKNKLSEAFEFYTKSNTQYSSLVREFGGGSYKRCCGKKIAFLVSKITLTHIQLWRTKTLSKQNILPNKTFTVNLTQCET